MRAAAALADPENVLEFSGASIWEIAIKRMLEKPEFHVDPCALRNGLLARDFQELPVTSEHALAVLQLPPIHGDPFDRLLIAQAISEGATLLTADRTIARYPGPILKV